MNRITEAGIYGHVPMHQYISDEVMKCATLNAGAAHTLVTRSPHHARHEHPRLNPDCRRDDSKAADIGTAAHALLLQSDDRGLAVVDAPDWRTKAAKEARDVAYANGLTPILAHKLAEVKAMVRAAKEFIAGSEIAGAFDSGLPEQTVIAMLGGVWCRARPDWLNDRLCVHFKTCESAQPDAWIRGQLQSQGYDMAHAFYTLALESIGRRVKSVFLVQETSAPYACSLVGLTPAYADLAAARVQRALGLWRGCLESDRWPAYPQRICYAEPKPWQLADEDERALATYFGDDPLQREHGVQA